MNEELNENDKTALNEIASFEMEVKKLDNECEYDISEYEDMERRYNAILNSDKPNENESEQINESETLNKGEE